MEVDYKVTAEINLDASRHDTVTVKANTERKAVKFAYEKLRKKHDNKMIIVQEVKLIDN